MVQSRMASGAVGLTVALAVGVYALTDDVVIDAVCYLGVLVGASIGAWVGAERAPRGQRTVPRLIAAGVALTTVGDMVWKRLDWLGSDPEMSIADPFWFASYAVLGAALWIVLRRSRGGHLDLDFAIDAVTIAVVCLLVVWSLVVDSIIADQTVSPLVRTVWATYPIAGAALLALVVRLLVIRKSRVVIDISLTVGVCLWLLGDIIYLRAPDASEVMLTTMGASWMVAPVLMAFAAWRVRDIEADPARSLRADGWVVPVLIAVGPLLVPPALEIAADLRGQPDQPGELFVGMALLVMLSLVRTGRLLRSNAGAMRELELARDAALEASRAKSMFLANMSHEIRTPLTTVLASAEILEDTPLNDLQLRLLAKMNRSGNLLMSLVEGVLDFSRVEAGQVDLRCVEFDLHTLVGDAADAYVPRARQADLEFGWHLDPLVPRTVLGDPTRVLQVVNNLLDNALKFTHQGRVTLEVRPAASDHTGCVEFVVADTGIGIREEDQASVFESFSQVDGSTTRRYGGNGLGLAICKDLTELMGGTLTLSSGLGSGSTFVVRIPLTRAARVLPLTA